MFSCPVGVAISLWFVMKIRTNLIECIYRFGTKSQRAVRLDSEEQEPEPFILDYHGNSDIVENYDREMGIRRGIDLATTLERIDKNFVITDPRLPDNPIVRHLKFCKPEARTWLIAPPVKPNFGDIPTFFLDLFSFLVSVCSWWTISCDKGWGPQINSCVWQCRSLRQTSFWSLPSILGRRF